MTRIAFVIDPLESLNIKKDSTLAMMWAAQRRDWEMHVLQTSDLGWLDGQVVAHTQRVSLNAAPDNMSESDDSLYRVEPIERLLASSFDIILMRKDPPFDMNYITTTYLLEQAELQGVLVVNKPASLRDCNEKFFTTSFAEWIPPQLVSSRSSDLIDFHNQHQDTIFKPLDGMGGKGIFRVQQDDPNLNVVLETLTKGETTPIVAQRYLPEIVDGDKRILIVNGNVVPYALARIPKSGESRGNLAVGGIGVPKPLTPRDQEIAEAMVPELMRRGLVFTGIDVIGDYLTEVNVTCPTCIRELDRECGLDIAMDLLDSLAESLP